MTFTAAEQKAAVAKFAPPFPASKHPEAAALAPIYKTEFAGRYPGTIRKVTLPWNETRYLTNDISGIYTERRIGFVVGFEKSPGQCFVTEATAQHAATDGRAKRFSPHTSGFFEGEYWPFPCQTMTGK